jgi:AcrR family transcriptional regulator
MGDTEFAKTSETPAGRATGTRGRIVRAAAGLLVEGGREAVTTRAAVAAAAGVQAPMIYRQFGDMRRLLDEVASFGFSNYLRDKTSRERLGDPLEDLRRGWDLHIGFGLENPAFYTLMYGDPRPGVEPAAAREAAEILHGLVRRIAEAGRVARRRRERRAHDPRRGLRGYPDPDRHQARRTRHRAVGGDP